MSEQQETFAKIELMGRLVMAGRVSEIERYGGKLGRVDVPLPPDKDCPTCGGWGMVDDRNLEGPKTERCPTCGERYTSHYFGASAVYLITFCSEQVARDIARNNPPQPISSYDYPSPVREAMQRARLPAVAQDGEEKPRLRDDDEGDDDDLEDEDRP